MPDIPHVLWANIKDSGEVIVEQVLGNSASCRRQPSTRRQGPLGPASIGEAVAIEPGQVDAYMADGTVPPELRCPISFEALRNPVRSGEGRAAYSLHALREWCASRNTLVDPLTQQRIPENGLRRDEALSAALHELRHAAQMRWRAAGEREKEWAVRWLRLHCQRLEARPVPGLFPLNAQILPASEVVDRVRGVVRVIEADAIRIVRADLRAQVVTYNRYLALALALAIARGALQLRSGDLASTFPAVLEILLHDLLGTKGTQMVFGLEGEKRGSARAFLAGLVLLLGGSYFQVISPLPEVCRLPIRLMSLMACLIGIQMGLARIGVQKAGIFLGRRVAGD